MILSHVQCSMMKGEKKGQSINLNSPNTEHTTQKCCHGIQVYFKIQKFVSHFLIECHCLGLVKADGYLNVHFSRASILSLNSDIIDLKCNLTHAGPIKTTVLCVFLSIK